MEKCMLFLETLSGRNIVSNASLRKSKLEEKYVLECWNFSFGMYLILDALQSLSILFCAPLIQKGAWFGVSTMINASCTTRDNRESNFQSRLD